MKHQLRHRECNLIRQYNSVNSNLLLSNNEETYNNQTVTMTAKKQFRKAKNAMQVQVMINGLQVQ